MWHWLHKNVRKLSLWLKIGLLSAGAHLVVLSLLFFVYRGSGDLALTVRADQLNSLIDVVWVKTLPSGRASISSGRGSQKGAQEKKCTSRTSSIKSGPKTELMQDSKEKKKRNVLRDPQDERNKKKIKKKVEKKVEEKKKKEENKCPSRPSGRTEEAKKVEVEKKTIEIKKSDTLSKIHNDQENNIDAQIDSLSVRPEGLEGIEGHTDEDLNFEFSGSYRDLEALQQFQELQQEISRCWRPPVGIAQDVSCQIKVSFDWEGRLQQQETVKSSGILMFDVSSRNAVAAMEAPKFVRGKTFTITFKP